MIPFSLQKASYQGLKGHLLEGEMPSFGNREDTSWKS